MADKRAETMGISRGIRPSTWDFMGFTRQKYIFHGDVMRISWEFGLNGTSIGIKNGPR